MSVNERLERIEEGQARSGERLARLETMTEEIHRCLKPTGGAPILVRLDRVERFQAGITKTLWAVVISAVTLTLGAVATVLGFKR